MLALDSLFVLITQHNLESPKFFEQLYSLFTPQMLFMSYKERFLELSHLALSSSFVR